ncbi:MAG: ABC transporter permease [Vicinamibacterales bacterium]
MRVYRWLLRLAPRRLRDKHGLEMEVVFRAALSESAQRGRGAQAATWLRAVFDVLLATVRDAHRRWARRTRVGIAEERRNLMTGSDIRYAWRSLTRQKLGSALVLAMLALGIGANVAVFSLINGLFLRPFPFPNPDRLVYINEAAPRWNLEMTGVNYPDFAQWHKDQQAFEALALYDTLTMNVAGEGGADRMNGASVTADFATAIGIQPVLGRLFSAEEDRPNGPNLVVIGYALWQERFAGRGDVLNQTLRLNSRQYTVIGVLPREAEFPGGVRFWIPMRGDPNSKDRSYSYDGIGRMKPGVSVAQAGQDLVRTHQPIFDARDKEKIVTPFARDLRESFAGNYRTIASTLGAAVSLLLLVACANVASVMLARALMRRREVGIRLAVGASRARLMRQLFAENLILSLVGGALGLLVGQWAIRLLVSGIPDEVPGWTTFVLDARTVAFTIGTSVATALVFGWAPVLHAVRGDLRGAMATAAAASTPPVRGSRTLRTLVGAEFVLASVMLVCCGLLVRAYDRVRQVDPGFSPEGAMTFGVSLPGVTYADDPMRMAFFERLEQRLAAVPGVTNTGLISCAPMSGCHWGQFFEAEGQPPRGPNDPNPVVLFRPTSAGYFKAMGIRLKAGRFLEPADGRDWPKKEGVVVVNETFARTLWPDGSNPVGRRVRWATPVPWITVVGVVADVKHYGLERDMRPAVYIPLPMRPQPQLTVAVRSTSDLNALMATARAIVRETDPELPIYNARTMEERMSGSVRLRAAYSWMLGVFAVMAVVLALGGSYGVTSYLVSQRTREIGIRVALGAARRDISRAVLGSTLRVVVIGVVAGLALAVGAGRWLSTLLFGVPPSDAIILTSAAGTLLLTAVLANILPARRAARVDPMVSLRTD